MDMIDTMQYVNLLLRPKNILVVDDDSLIRLVFKETERIFRCQMTFAPSCTEALDYLKEHKFDYIFLDMKLEGGSDGMEVLHSINSMGLESHIIIMSGSVNLHDLMQEANRLGVLSFLNKPTDFTVVYLRTVFDRIGLKREKESEIK